MTEFILPTEEEKKVAAELHPNVVSVTEMSSQQKEFLTALILRKKPKKILEIGVSAGGSSCLILNTIKHLKDSEFYSIDYRTTYYKKPQNLSGYIVKQEYPDLVKNWELFTPGLTCNYLDKIGKDIDFCFIDAAHSNPGEILDCLMILPYLKENATLVFHDTALHLLCDNTTCYTNCILMSTLKGTKITSDLHPEKFNNIGAVTLTENIVEDNLFELFNALMLPWSYKLKGSDYNDVLAHFEKYYDEYYVNLFKKIKNSYDIILKNAKKKKPLSLSQKIKITYNIIKSKI